MSGHRPPAYVVVDREPHPVRSLTLRLTTFIGGTACLALGVVFSLPAVIVLGVALLFYDTVLYSQKARLDTRAERDLGIVELERWHQLYDEAVMEGKESPVAVAIADRTDTATATIASLYQTDRERVEQHIAEERRQALLEQNLSTHERAYVEYAQMTGVPVWGGVQGPGEPRPPRKPAEPTHRLH